MDEHQPRLNAARPDRDHRYPRSALVGDYLRAASGLGMTLTPLVAADPAPVVAWGLGLAAGLFAWFVLQTAVLQATRVVRERDGLVVRRPRVKRLAWRDLERLRLAFYAPRRRPERGWMQLSLKGGGVTVRLDSTLDGFEGIVRDAAAAARANGLGLDPVTESNLDELAGGLLGRDQISRR